MHLYMRMFGSRPTGRFGYTRSVRRTLSVGGVINKATECQDSSGITNGVLSKVRSLKEPILNNWGLCLRELDTTKQPVV